MFAYGAQRTYCGRCTCSVREAEDKMIDLYYWTTPNGHKVLIFLEEVGVPHRILPVNMIHPQ